MNFIIFMVAVLVVVWFIMSVMDDASTLPGLVEIFSLDTVNLSGYNFSVYNDTNVSLRSD